MTGHSEFQPKHPAAFQRAMPTQDASVPWVRIDGQPPRPIYLAGDPVEILAELEDPVALLPQFCLPGGEPDPRLSCTSGAELLRRGPSASPHPAAASAGPADDVRGGHHGAGYIRRCRQRA